MAEEWWGAILLFLYIQIFAFGNEIYLIRWNLSDYWSSVRRWRLCWVKKPGYSVRRDNGLFLVLGVDDLSTEQLDFHLFLLWIHFTSMFLCTFLVIWLVSLLLFIQFLLYLFCQFFWPLNIFLILCAQYRSLSHSFSYSFCRVHIFLVHPVPVACYLFHHNLWYNTDIPEQFTVKAYPALFEGEGQKN